MKLVKLTNRDIALLKLLASTGLLGTTHIRSHLFGGAARTTVLRRLRMLERNYLIKRVLGLESQEVLWMLTRQGANEARVELPKRSWSKNMLEHDFSLVDLRLRLEAAGFVHSWMPEHQIRTEMFRKHGPKDFQERIVPDGLIGVLVDGKSESIALELELTLKNQTRIRKTLKKYMSKEGIYALWYVAPKMSILNSIWKCWQINGGPQSKVKLHCSLFDEVLKSPLKARLLGTKPRLTIGESWIIRSLRVDAHGVSRQNSILQSDECILNTGNDSFILKDVS